ncbi:hypothetical protein CAPTEDRAFT_220098 [Capitella teleta]|uniref:C2H2-type domain-containing protein n=1 Tax=Capitella teleta TaxID=283909 RepID=R7UP21_CAPTE|nr:hypothetical protein CAPTEDRAFT_220098 [Capitella teleta]|eukprot:ELU08279.1 hypothetical protein CAPTEDRAFT_220098 [Capitella teleta]
MVMKEEQEKLRRLLSDAIPLLCKNALAFKNEFTIEALIGITIDKDQVVLVNINDTLHADTSSLEPDSQLDDSNEAEVKVERNSQRRKRRNPGRHLQTLHHIEPQADEEDDDPYVDQGALQIAEENVKRQKVSPTVIKTEPDRLVMVEGSDDPDLDTFLNSSQADNSTADYPTTLRSLPSTSTTAQPPVTPLPDSVLQPSPLQQQQQQQQQPTTSEALTNHLLSASLSQKDFLKRHCSIQKGLLDQRTAYICNACGKSMKDPSNMTDHATGKESTPLNLSVARSRRKALPPQRVKCEDEEEAAPWVDAMVKEEEEEQEEASLPQQVVFPGTDKFPWHTPLPQRDLNYNSLFPVMTHLLVPKKPGSASASPAAAKHPSPQTKTPRSTPQGQKSRKGLVHVTKGTYYSGDHPYIVRQEGPPRCYLCKLCNLTFKTFRIACDHLRGIHENTYMYFCNVCGESFKWRSTLRTHKLKTQCGATANSEDAAKQGSSPHTAKTPPSKSPSPAPVPEQVPSPSDLFQSGDRMPQDFMVKISPTSRACTICQKVYSGSSACTSTLDHICAEHLKIYRHVFPQPPQPQALFPYGGFQPRSFIVKLSSNMRGCSICQKVYKSSSAYTSILDHICAVHFNVFRHACNKCSKKFRWSPEMTAHRKVCGTTPASSRQ